MTREGPEHPLNPPGAGLSQRLDALRQVIREIEGMQKLEDIVPIELLWERPPGLPSGAELLWIIRLLDRNVFGPSVAHLEASGNLDLEEPDYGRLLDATPCTAESLQGLVEAIRTSREALIDNILNMAATKPEDMPNVETLIDAILAHDRRVLAGFTERLYEGGLGG